MIIVVNIIREIAGKVAQRLTTDPLNPYRINFQHGPGVEIVNTIKEYSRYPLPKRNEKFPLIALFQDFEERNIGANRVECSLKVVICTDTESKYVASERYDYTFKPILYPIYEAFIEEIKRSQNTETGYEIEHTKIDRVFYGSENNEANVFDDFVDAIELKNLVITFKNNC